MRIVSSEEFFKEIDQKKAEVDEAVLRKFSETERIRRRPRDKDEQDALNIICREKWLQAEKDGKIKYLSERVIEYHVDGTV